MLLWVMGVGFDNTCTVSGKWNISRVIPRLYGWVYKTLRLSLLAVRHSVVVMTSGFQWRRSQIESYQFSVPVLSNLCLESVGAKNFKILVEDSDAGGPISITVRMEYLLEYFSILILWSLCGKPIRGSGRGERVGVKGGRKYCFVDFCSSEGL